MIHSRLTIFGSAALLWFVTGCGEEDKSDRTDHELCTEAATTTWDGTTLSHTAPHCAQVSLTARALGSGDLLIDFAQNEDGGWSPTISSASGGSFSALVLEGPWQTQGSTDAVLWRQGYQSWSWSGVTKMESLTLDAAGVPDVGGDGDALTVIHESPGTSWWVGLAGRQDGASLIMGQQGATKTRFFSAFDDDTAWAVWGHRGDEITLEPGSTLTLDPLWLSTDIDPWKLHTDYADAVTDRVGTAVPKTQPITGWATWYQYFEDITEADVRDNFAPAAKLGLEVFQIDDGWQRLWGDWQADEGFPSGMAGLARDIKAEGFIPGLWMAPMYVHRETDTYQDHPDWWVRDLDGDELSFSNLGTGDYAVIDVTHPDAAAWLTEVIETKVDEGWEYFKFDFLYAAAQVGLRHEPVTGIEAYHQAMTLLRAAIGEHWFLACGAPMLPSVGYAESFRSGADIAFGFDRIPTLAYLRWQARSTATRSFSNGRWWWMDADQILVRPPLEEHALTGPLVANAISGGVWMLGDDLSALAPDRQELAMTEAVVALRGQTPVPDAPLAATSGLDGGPVLELTNPNDVVPTVWRFPDGEVALLNLSEADVTLNSPGGTELLSGEAASPGPRTLSAGAGEIWRP